MYHHKLIGLSLILVVLLVPFVTFAGTSIYRPIGGRILDTGAVGRSFVTCFGAYGPLSIQPFVPALTFPYVIRTPLGGAPRVGGYFLGLYKQTPNLGDCVNTQTEAPVPSYEITTYGVSR